MKHRELDVRRSTRSGVNDKKTYEFDENEIEKLKIGCWDPSIKTCCELVINSQFIEFINVLKCWCCTCMCML